MSLSGVKQTLGKRLRWLAQIAVSKRRASCVVAEEAEARYLGLIEISAGNFCEPN